MPLEVPAATLEISAPFKGAPLETRTLSLYPVSQRLSPTPWPRMNSHGFTPSHDVRHLTGQSAGLWYEFTIFYG